MCEALQLVSHRVRAPFAMGHLFCESQGGLRKSGFLRMVRTNTNLRYFWQFMTMWEKENLASKYNLNIQTENYCGNHKFFRNNKDLKDSLNYLKCLMICGLLGFCSFE